MAALIGTEFKLDPVEVLKSDRFDWSIRVASLRYLQQEREKAANKKKG